MNDASSISPTSLTLKCSFNVALTLFINVVQCRINTYQHCVSLVYIVQIADIAMLYDIESTSCRHRLTLITWFTYMYFTSSTSQYYIISNQHRVDIAIFDYLIYIADILNIAMLYYIESTSCRHRLHESFSLMLKMYKQGVYHITKLVTYKHIIH